VAETEFTAIAPAVAVLRDGEPLDIVSGGRADALVWPGMGSQQRSMHRLELAAGGSTVVLLHETEAAYVVAEGSGRVGEAEVGERHIVYVPKRTPYHFSAGEPMTIYGGPCPPDLSLYGEAEPRSAADAAGGEIRVFDPAHEGVPLPMISKQARLVVWPGSGAEIATMNFVVLEPGEENAPHLHAASDDTIAILEGRGSIDDLTSGETHEFGAGDVVFVRTGVQHKVKADRGAGIVSAGGPCPPDYGMLEALGLV
jgi:quercetin dioxygenase-like cupin family protein